MRQVNVNALYLQLIELDVSIAENIIRLFALPDPKNIYTDLFTLPNKELSKLNSLIGCYQRENPLYVSKNSYNDVHGCCIINITSLKGVYDVKLNSFSSRLKFYDGVSQINVALFEGHTVKTVIETTPIEFKLIVPLLVDLYNNHNAILVYPIIEKTQGSLSYYSLENGIIGVYFE